jgi:hypothetical protein
MATEMEWVNLQAQKMENTSAFGLKANKHGLGAVTDLDGNRTEGIWEHGE